MNILSARPLDKLRECHHSVLPIVHVTNWDFWKGVLHVQVAH